MIKKITIVLVGFFLLGGCYYDKEDLLYPDAANCTSLNSSFAVNVAPLIQSRCAVSGCHDAASTNGPGPLTSYGQIKNAAVQIKSAVVSRFMPENSSLNLSEIKTISCWVDAGAKDN